MRPPGVWTRAAMSGPWVTLAHGAAPKTVRERVKAGRLGGSQSAGERGPSRCPLRAALDIVPERAVRAGCRHHPARYGPMEVYTVSDSQRTTTRRTALQNALTGLLVAGTGSIAQRRPGVS